MTSDIINKVIMVSVGLARVLLSKTGLETNFVVTVEIRVEIVIFKIRT